jgi:UDP:flavonoid glycosyltransferase YjiC (YdhE family)
MLRMAVDEVLGDASFRDNAARISREFSGTEGAERAADSAESLLRRI